jgi:hypothetical protein
MLEDAEGGRSIWGGGIKPVFARIQETKQSLCFYLVNPIAKSYLMVEIASLSPLKGTSPSANLAMTFQGGLSKKQFPRGVSRAIIRVEILYEGI